MAIYERAEQIQILKERYVKQSVGRDNLLKMITESELPEMVYNSNAIENSTLTLAETERILLEQEIMRSVSARETYEAINLGRVIKYLWTKPNYPLTIENLELLHQMLLGGINDRYAGHVRGTDEWVRIGNHIAPAPELVKPMLNSLLAKYQSNDQAYFLEQIAHFHLEFEFIHPFLDGNGRMGRVLINQLLAALGYPPIIIPNKNKRVDYYPNFVAYQKDRDTEKPVSVTKFTKILALYILESLHKRLAYLNGYEIITVVEYANRNDLSVNSALNSSKRQTLPAFRQSNVWKIGVPL
ncbi:MAG: Fic family protein [Bifidobacteriaceae bacterium]|jgi:Fic family protein|nr:Fic family protein [Bifidobacteriaceae bacterium]